MQNVDPFKDIENNFESGEGPTSLVSLPETTNRPPLLDDEHQTIHSDPETQVKPKTRSRFSSAFRKLSKSTRRSKDSSKVRKHQSETSVHSGGQEPIQAESLPTADSKPKKKRFLLGTLKKSKETTTKTKSTIEDTQIVQPTPVRDYQDKETIIESETILTEAPPPLRDRVRTVQITISGTKIEQTSVSRRDLPFTRTEITGSSIESAEYLTPIVGTLNSSTSRIVRGAPTNVNSSLPLSLTQKSFPVVEQGRKKKLISKKIDAQTHLKSIPSNTAQSQVLSLSQSRVNDGRFIITQSILDTPPLERAPAKPSRLAATTSVIQTSSSTGTIRKSTNKSGTLTASPSLSQRIRNTATHLTTVKQQKQRSIGRDTAALMPNSPINNQRGHRLPKPTTTVSGNQTPNTSPTKTEKPKTETIPIGDESNVAIVDQNQQQPPHQGRIQLQLESHGSQPPLPIRKTSNESSTLQKFQDTSVAIALKNSEDEPVSSAESALPSDYSDRKIENLSQDISSGSLQFPIGKVVHSSDISVIDKFNEQHIDLHSSSSHSKSPISASGIRKRIHYVPQPTIDDFDSLKLKRDHLKYSVYSPESDSSSGDSQMPAFGDLTMDSEMEPTIMTSANSEKREHLYKILVIGELGTGKTSFIKRYVHQFFSQNYRATIGVDFALKVLQWDVNTIVRLQLWDIAGQERFGNMTRVYYKEAVGAFIVFDVTRSGTFDCVTKWKEDLDSKVQLPDGSPIPCILLANKCDQEKQGIITAPEKLDDFVRENGFVGWFETSAKENINIDDAAKALVNNILLNDKLISAADLADSEKFNLNNTEDGKHSNGKSKCAC